MADDIGAMRERLTIQQDLWPTLPVTSLTRSGTTATAVTHVAHGYASQDYVTIVGAVPAGYTGKVKITVVDAVTFTYPVSAALSSPATQATTVTYASDAGSGRKAHWVACGTIFAERIALTATERLQAATIQAIVTYSFRVRVRPDLSPQQRALWTPRWPVGAAERTLEINGVLPWTDPYAGGTRFSLLQCAEVAA